MKLHQRKRRTLARVRSARGTGVGRVERTVSLSSLSGEPLGVSDMRRSYGLVVAGVLLVLAACSSGSSVTTYPTSSGNSVLSTSTSPSAMTASTSVTSASASTSTVAPTTTTSMPVSTSIPLLDQVRSAAIAFAPYYVDCLRKPASCDVAKFTAENSDARAVATKTIGDLVRGGFFVGDEDAGYTVIESVEPQSDFVLVKTCEWSTMVLYGPPRSPGGPPLVQNDTHGTTRIERQWVLDGGVWKVRHEDDQPSVAGVNQCGAKP